MGRILRPKKSNILVMYTYIYTYIYYIYSISKPSQFRIINDSSHAHVAERQQYDSPIWYQMMLGSLAPPSISVGDLEARSVQSLNKHRMYIDIIYTQ